MNLGPTELIIILVIVLVLFGSTRLPKLAKSLGQASKEFKKGIDDKDAEDEDKGEAAKGADEKITMSKSELDALLAEREAKAREAQAPPPAAPDVPPSA